MNYIGTRSMLFQQIGARIAQTHPGVWIDEGGGARHLEPDEARAEVRGDGPSAPLRHLVWRAAIGAALSRQPDCDLANYFVLWLGEPWIRRAVAFIVSRLHVEVEEAEAEMVACFVDELSRSDPTDHDAGEKLLRAASRRTWREFRRGNREFAFRDMAAFAMKDQLVNNDDGWELEINPPPASRGLRAPIRIKNRKQAEGELVGMIARDFGLEEIVYRARRLYEGRAVGRLSIRRIGAAR
ncbi:hypothetical protein [Actinomadura atramentaria]|uniref:hypothetical protein n=1 Tax=Actinomadura atramentaria TaxID=1990 RepID=UPI000365713C|nr:hypothetical protein [Actinomadura atramentaria]